MIKATIPAITMQQPYGWLLLEGHVTREKRCGMPPAHGPMAIIAGRRQQDTPQHVNRMQQDFRDCPNADDFVYGAIMGVVDVVECRKTDEPGMPFVWELRNPRRLQEPPEYEGSAT